MNRVLPIPLFALLFLFPTMIHAEDDLQLPDPLVTANGQVVRSVGAWVNERRPEILELFRREVYGRVPVEAEQAEVSFYVFDHDPAALGGRAIRKQVAIEISSGADRLRMDLLLYLPVSAQQTPVPVVVLLNFNGNHTINADPAIALPKSEVAEEHSPPENFRGIRASRFPVEEILKRGYGVATVYCGDIDPDYDDGFRNGVHALFYPPGQCPGDAWGTVAAWAWGLSRCMDYFETDAQVDSGRVAVLGHSRLGKAALWAGAQDERFSIVFSNESGCTGAALAKRKHGETVEAINDRFPHWFCENYKRYNDREEDLPVDQHLLIALMAPRPVYVASATEDDWADPKGEFLSCVHARPVYELFGMKGLPIETMPNPNEPVHGDHVGYHLRAGKHDLTAYDWKCYLDFAGDYWGAD